MKKSKEGSADSSGGASHSRQPWREFKQTIARDLHDIREFYLEEEQKVRLETMKPLARAFYQIVWLLKSLILKLTPVRRLLLVVAIVFLAISVSSIPIGTSHFRLDIKSLAAILLIFILMLELKDKLLAHTELAEGREVQKRLMPTACPEIAGWDVWFSSQTANDVGGDLIDCVCLDEAHFGLSLGDVSGKGLPAALLMAKLQATIRALAADISSISELAARINRIVHRDTPHSTFATLVYIDIRNNQGKIRLINAGHMPPILLRSGRTQLTPKGDAALGISPETVYHIHEENLDTGDALVVYSDGINEVKNAAGEYFGTERLCRLLESLPGLPSSGIGQRILEAVSEFLGDIRPQDDQTLLILRRPETEGQKKG